uniref:C-type lectin domain-containing protein n=1 Tax=Salarias fasciatus TaxID=181472 RepID=A0A672HWB0_SALFA
MHFLYFRFKKELHLYLIGFGLISCSNVVHPKYRYITLNKTWTEAQQFCRQFFDDLATFEMLSLITGHEVWIGLYREAWMWSDGSNSSFQNWRTGQPSNDGYSQSCVAEYPDHDWDDRPCQSEIPFICQGGKISKFISAC